jgi:hypothetical protein
MEQVAEAAHGSTPDFKFTTLANTTGARVRAPENVFDIFPAFAVFMTDADRKPQQNLRRARIAREIHAALPHNHADRVASVFFMLEMERGDASKLMQRTLFDLPHTLSADADDRGDLLGRVLAFVRDVDRAVTSRFQAVLAIAAVLKVIAAMRVATGIGAVLIGAIGEQRESACAPNQQHRAVGVRSAHASI